MNELQREIAQFEEGASQLTTALRQTEQALRRCHELEEVLLRAMDFVVMLDDGTLTERQVHERQTLLEQTSQLLVLKEASCSVST